MEVNDDSAAPPEIEAQPMVRCEVTGQLVPAEDVVEFQGRVVSAEGKEELLRQMRNSGGDLAAGELMRPGFWRRLLCSMLDNMILGGVFAVIGVFVMLGTSDSEDFDRALNRLVVMVGAVTFLYFAVMHAKFGKTVGKMAGGYRVVNMDGTAISTRTAFVRAFWSSGIVLVVTIIGLFMVTEESALIEGILDKIGNFYNLANGIVLVSDRKYNRAIHDRLAGTRVVMDPKR